MQNVLCVTAVASEPDVPPYLYDVVGDVKWKEIKFRCDLSFYGTNVMWLDMDVKMEVSEGAVIGAGIAMLHHLHFLNLSFTEDG